MSMKVKFWGVRGLLPVAPPPQGIVNNFRNLLNQFFSQGYSNLKDVDVFLDQHKLTAIGGYGSCSTCVEIQTSQVQVIIDAGSGLKRLGDEIMQAEAAGKGQGTYHILLTHFHMDHLLGLPFFTPIFIPGNVIHFYAVQKELANAVRAMFTPPYFPVDFSALPSKILFHPLEPRQSFTIGDLTLTPYLLDHIDPAWGYKIQSENKTYAHCSDTEGLRISPNDLGADLPLYEDIDLMYFDAQYPTTKYRDTIRSGYSSSHLGLDIAMRMGIKRVLFGHHDPDASTAGIQALENKTQAYYLSKLAGSHSDQLSVHPVDWSFVYEGQTLEL